MQTTVVSSHGKNCPYNVSSKVFRLPPNVIVFMNCYNTPISVSLQYDARFWAFLTDAKLHLALKKEKLTVNNVSKLLEGLKKLNDVDNKMCVFTDKCPDLTFTYEKNSFRSGIFQCPVSVVVKDTSHQVLDRKITNTMFTDVANNADMNKKDKKFTRAWLKVDDAVIDKRYLMTAKPHKHFPEMNGVDNVLSKIVDDVSKSEPNKMHLVIAWACRGGKPMTIKLQQYAPNDNPFQTAIIVYDKLRTFIENKNKN
jgi:hypothetical protein